jgi:exodeoxyribonuclease VII large subunit
VPDRAEWLAMLRQLEVRFTGAMTRQLRAHALALGAASQRLQVSHPGARLAQHTQRLDDLDQRLRSALRGALLHERQRLETLGTRLWRENPRHRLEVLCSRAATLRQRMVTAFSGSLTRLDQRLALAARTLDAVSPLATLERGFAVIRRVDDGALLRDAGHAPAGTEIEARLSKGRIRAVVKQQLKNDE